MAKIQSHLDRGISLESVYFYWMYEEYAKFGWNSEDVCYSWFKFNGFCAYAVMLSEL